jgi:hypothetical protein
MSREIKFRTYLEGIGFKYFKVGEDVVISTKNGANQFTGLLDKKGVEIYEGDIIKSDGYSPFEVFYDGPSFVALWKNRDNLKWDLNNPALDGIIIGNIYENEDLLNENISRDKLCGKN